MKHYAVITFLFNKYDLLREPVVVDEEADYYCLTDDSTLKSDTWNIIYIDKFDTDKFTGVQKTYMAKYSFYKYLPEVYDYYVTIDAAIEIVGKLSPVIEMFDKYDYNIGLSMHPARDNWLTEYSCWTGSRGLDRKYVKMFEDYATQNGFNPKGKNGLIECTVKIYKNTPDVIGFINNVYTTLGLVNNFEDKNDQCYFTCVLGLHLNRLSPVFFTRNFYACSKYMVSYFHGTNTRVTTGKAVDINYNPRRLFGNIVNLIDL